MPPVLLTPFLATLPLVAHASGAQLGRASPLPVCSAQPTCPWPAEPPTAALDLTSIEGPGANDFHEDLSGLAWNPFQGALWACRNGPGANSKVWKLERDASGAWRVGTVAGARAEWTGFGDCEALALARWSEPHMVYCLEESGDLVQQWDLSGATPQLRRTWDLTPHVPAYANGLGLEGLAFVDDISLAVGGFVDAAGQPRLSTQGMGSLCFVGHQAGGHVYVFDLAPAGGFQFVGRYATGGTETAELCFDGGMGVLHVLHGDGVNDIEVVRLSSTADAGGRRLDRVLAWDYPGSGNEEGWAVQWWPNDCVGGRRQAFMATDDGGSRSLRAFQQFPCGF